MSWLHCFWGIGASIGPIIISAFLIHRNSWSLGYKTIGIIQLCLVALLFISLPLWRKNESYETETKHRSVKFMQLFHITGVKQVLIAFFCYCTIETVTGLWGSSYLVIVKNISPEVAAQWIALYYIGIMSGRFISGFVTMKLNNRKMIRLGQGIIACGIIIFILPFGNSTVLPGLFMIGLGCAPIFPSLLHETPQNFGGEYSQSIMGIQMACAYIGTTLMPTVFGWLATYISFSIFPIFIGMILIVKIIIVEKLNKRVDGTFPKTRILGKS
jgi:fucose permease